jgi:hypothetical protein
VELDIDGVPNGLLCREDGTRTVIALDEREQVLRAATLDDAGHVADVDQLEWPARLLGLAYAPSSVTARFGTVAIPPETGRDVEESVAVPYSDLSVFAFAGSGWIKSPASPVPGERTYLTGDGRSFAALAAPFKIRGWEGIFRKPG